MAAATAELEEVTDEEAFLLDEFHMLHLMSLRGGVIPSTLYGRSAKLLERLQDESVVTRLGDFSNGRASLLRRVMSAELGRQILGRERVRLTREGVRRLEAWDASSGSETYGRLVEEIRENQHLGKTYCQFSKDYGL